MIILEPVMFGAPDVSAAGLGAFLTNEEARPLACLGDPMI